MSVKMMGQVWECQFTKAEQSVMLAMADHAKDDGTDCYPSIERIAWKTDYSTRQVQRVIKDLSERGILILIRKGGRGRAAEYRIDLGKANIKPDFAPKKHDTVSPYSLKHDMVSSKSDPKKDDTVSCNTAKDDMVSSNRNRERVTFEAIKGDISGLKDDIAMSPQSLTIKPSLGKNGIISSSDAGEIEFMPTTHPIQHLPYKASAKPAPAPPLFTEAWWVAMLAELEPSLPGVAISYLAGSCLDDLRERAQGAPRAPDFRVVVEERAAAGVTWLTAQAGPAIERKLSSILGKRVQVEIVAAEQVLGFGSGENRVDENQEAAKTQKEPA